MVFDDTATKDKLVENLQAMPDSQAMRYYAEFPDKMLGAEHLIDRAKDVYINNLSMTEGMRDKLWMEKIVNIFCLDKFAGDHTVSYAREKLFEYFIELREKNKDDSLLHEIINAIESHLNK